MLFTVAQNTSPQLEALIDRAEVRLLEQLSPAEGDAPLPGDPQHPACRAACGVLEAEVADFARGSALLAGNPWLLGYEPDAPPKRTHLNAALEATLLTLMWRELHHRHKLRRQMQALR